MNRIYRVANFDAAPAALALQETLFHNANGYIGVRGTLEEGLLPTADTMRGMYVNGFYDIAPMKQAEKLCNLVEDKETMLNVADTQTIRFTFGGETFSLFEGTVLHMERVLDMDAGTTTRTVMWRSPMGKEVQISFCRMTSFEHLSLFTIDCKVTPLNFSGEVIIKSCHVGLVKNYANPNDPRLSAESGTYLKAISHENQGAESWILTKTITSELTLCTGVAHELSLPATIQSEFDEKAHCVTCTFAVQLRQGEEFRFVKYTTFADSLRTDDCLATAKRDISAAFGKLDEMYVEQRQYLAKFWAHSQLEIDGDADDNQAMCFNLYQLLQSAGKDGHCSIAAKGLSGEGYEGHYFWDTEMYMMPFFTLTNPALAQQLLSYRYSILDAARENARLLGHQKGALYPWRTIHGKECSGYFPSGTAQYHINGAIAYAVVSHYLATGDVGFLAKQGAEILFETARLWFDVGTWYQDSFRIHDVTGPDEYTCMVDNNFYTNVCAQFNMRWACKAATILKESGEYVDIAQKLALTDEEFAQFDAAAAKMYLPYDETLQINPQDDSFLSKPVWDIAATPKENFPLLLHYHPLNLYRYQVCKQADTVLAYCLFDGVASQEAMRRSYEYYEKVTTHDSSLSTCIFSIVAARLGMREKAWTYFGNSATADLMDSHGNTKDGIHTANMGGCYMAVVNGFAGLRLTESHLTLAPYVPGNWEGYRFEIGYRGSLLEVDVRNKQCTVTLLEGAPVPVCLYGKEFTLEANVTLACQ